MKTRRILASLLLLPYLTVSGFQGNAATSVRRKRALPFLKQQVLAVEGETSTDDSAVDASCPLDELPPVIQQIADDRKEFQLNLGRAMDTLRKDYPDILHKKPDFSIFDDNVSAIDPSGVQLTGLNSYKSALSFFQTFVSFWFQGKSRLQFRMIYDFPRASIRISWNAILIPKLLGRPLYVDGISYYQLDRSSGKIVEHKIEKLLINNTPVAPPYGILSILQQDMFRVGQPHGIPVGIGAMSGYQ